MDARSMAWVVGNIPHELVQHRQLRPARVYRRTFLHELVHELGAVEHQYRRARRA